MLNSVLYLKYFLLRTQISQDTCIYGNEKVYIFGQEHMYEKLFSHPASK